MALIYISSVAQAAQSTAADFNNAFSASVTALDKTADYAKLIKSGDYYSAVECRQDCDSQERILDFILDNVSGAEAIGCAMQASIVVMGRYKTLDYYIHAINAYKANDIANYEKYGRSMATAYQQAEKDRLDFKNKYGY